jgi:hypothetical protein
LMNINEEMNKDKKNEWEIINFLNDI